MRALAIAWLALGCSEEPGSLPNAPADAAIDASVVEGKVVTVTVTEAGVPAVGASVYFQNPDSSLVRAATTDADGKARAEVADGGFVTVIEPRPSAIGVIVIRDRLSTFAGVKPGDELHLELRPVASGSVTLEIQVPDDPGAEAYDLHTSCGRAQLTAVSPTTPASVTLAGCDGIADMLVISSDLSGQPIHALYRPGQPVSEGAALALTGPYVDLVPVAVLLTNAPAWARNYQVEMTLASSRGLLTSALASIDPAAPAATLRLPVAAATTASLRTDIYPTQPTVARQSVLAWGLPLADQTVDLGTAAVRVITGMPVFDPATRTVTWTEDPGRAPDVVRAELYTYREGDPAHAWTWQIVAPYGGSALTLPVLQGAAAAELTTLATDSFTIAELETLAISGGYDRIRPGALRRALDGVPGGASGQLTYQRLYVENLLVSPTGPSLPPATFTRATR